MRMLRAGFSRLLGLFRMQNREREMNEEIESNLQLHIDDNLRSGMTAEEARRWALVRLGGIEAARERYRARRGIPFVEASIQDIRYALRELRRNPGFTAVTVLTLALAIGANTAIFTIVNAVLIERLPFRDADRVVVLWERSPQRPDRPNVISPGNFVHWQERATSFESMAAFYDWRTNFTGQGEPEELTVQDVTSNYFKTVGVEPILGRTFAADEGPEGNDGVTVISYSLWQRRFGADPSVVGRRIQLNTRLFQVIGVMPPGSELFLKEGSLAGKAPELWTVFAFTEAARTPDGRYMSAIGRLKPGVTLQQAQTEMSGIAASLAVEFPKADAGWRVQLTPVREDLSGAVRPALLVLSGAVACVLLICCANVASLMLARGASRQREIAVRGALGATRWRVVRQLLTESLVLGVVGGTAGLGIARWSVRLLLVIAPRDLSQLWNIRISYPVLAFTAIASIVTAMVCGLAPALEVSRIDVQESLREGLRVLGLGIRQRRFRQAFVIAEVALSTALLAGAGLLLQSLANLRSVNPGFDFHNILTFRTTLPIASYPNTAEGRARTIQFFRRAVDGVRELPGVQEAGMISFLPFAGIGAATGFTIEGRPAPPPGHGNVTDVRVCDNGYFGSMNIPLLGGRLFSEREMTEKSNVVIVSDSLARQYFPGEEPIGKRVTIDMTMPNVPTQIIGIVGDVKDMDLITPSRPTAYWPQPQLVMGFMTITVKTAVRNPLELTPSIGQVIRSLDKNQPLADVRTMDQWVHTSFAEARFNSILLSVFAGVALLLAAVGIYGLMSYTVSQRASEIGIRLALGANAREVQHLMIAAGARLVFAGLAIGLPLSWIANRSLTTMIYEATGGVVSTTVAAVMILAVVGLLSSYLPARRASRIAAVDALRHS